MTIGELFDVLVDIPKFVIRVAGIFRKEDIYQGYTDVSSEPDSILNIPVEYIGIKDKNTIICYCDSFDIDEVFERDFEDFE